jgi:hypothetical protein
LAPEVFLKKKNLGSVEMLNKISYDVLGGVCRSRKEGQTGEDILKDIFELTPRHCGIPRDAIGR